MKANQPAPDIYPERCDVNLKSITREETLKQNAIQLARHHRETCIGQDCTISLWMLRELLEAAQIPLTHEEIKEFV